MEKLNINELMRYGFAGGIALLVQVVAFWDPLRILAELPKTFFGTTIIFGIILLLGSLIYALHRAVLYNLFYLLLVRWKWGKGTSSRTLDFQRWERYRDDSSLQHNFREWASQIHYLYCASWAVGGSLLVGGLAGWTSTRHWLAPWILAAGLFVVSLVHHIRYTSYERELPKKQTTGHTSRASGD